MGHYVYKYVYNGETIYIGKNDTNLRSRINQHRAEKRFSPYLLADIYYASLSNKYDSDLMETLLIRKYRPLLNISKNQTNSEISFNEPEWKLYIDDDFKTEIQNKSANDIRREKSKAAWKRRKFEQNKKKLGEMLLKQFLYQYMSENKTKIDDRGLNITVPIDPKFDIYNLSISFSLDEDKPYRDIYLHDKFYRLMNSARWYEDKQEVTIYLNEDEYELFINNVDRIIERHRIEIEKFVEDNELQNELINFADKDIT